MKLISGYSDFIELNLLTESNVVYSDTFKRVIKNIDDHISKKLLEIENVDLDLKSNYFDVSLEKNDKISFIPDKKAQDLMSKYQPKWLYTGSGGWLKHKPVNSAIFDKLGYTGFDGKEYKPSGIDQGVIIAETTSSESGRTYAWVKFTDLDGNPTGEGVYNKNNLILKSEEEPVWYRNRQEINIGRAIKALLDLTDLEFTSRDLENFVNNFKSTIDKFNDKFSLFEIISGDDIAKWYRWENYMENSGSLGNSCMKAVPSRYFSIYMENPDVCKMVILRSKENRNKIDGRAILWKLNNGNMFLDRKYTIRDSDIQLFDSYAKEMGWYSKYYNNSSANTTAWDPKGGTGNPGEIINIKPGEYSGYPYMDTFKFFNPDIGIISSNNSDGVYKLESTGGDYIDCDYCGGSGRVDCPECDGGGWNDCRRCDGDGHRECRECRGHGYIDCDNCDGSGELEDGTSCTECSGGRLECSGCDSDGQNECRECDGDGKIECSECYGEGTVSCSECS